MLKRNDLISCIDNPEWGRWRVTEDPTETGVDECYNIRGEAGPRILFLSEFKRFWKMEKEA